MSNNVPEIDELIKQFQNFQDLFKISKKNNFELINNKGNMVKPLAQSLSRVYKKVVRCEECENLKIIEQPCICNSVNHLIKFVW